jgi:hypothetical protein
MGLGGEAELPKDSKRHFYPNHLMADAAHAQQPAPFRMAKLKSRLD